MYLEDYVSPAEAKAYILMEKKSTRHDYSTGDSQCAAALPARVRQQIQSPRGFPARIPYAIACCQKDCNLIGSDNV